MKKRFSRPNIPLLVISSLLAVMIWIDVQAQNMQIKTSTIAVPLKVENLDPKLVITEIDGFVTVTIEGPGDKLNDPGLKNAEAIVDLSKAKLGRQTYTAVVDAPDPDVRGLLPRENSKVRIDIEPRASKALNVTVETKGRLSDHNLRYDASATEPGEITFSGSQKDIDLIVKARVMLDLDGVDPNDSERTFSLPVEALDKQGRPVPYAIPSFSFVKVRPTFEPATVDKELFIIPKLIGRPPTGFEVRDYRAIPEKINVTGSSMKLAQSSTVLTDPIDVSKMTQTTTVPATLELPAELTPLHPQPVTVRIVILRQELPKSAPPPAPVTRPEPTFPDRVPPLTPIKGGSH